MQLLSDKSRTERARRPVDRLAVASLASSLLWLYGLGSLLGAVLGVIALRRLPGYPAVPERRGRGLAVAGLILGVVGLIVTVIALFLLVQAMEDLEYPM